MRYRHHLIGALCCTALACSSNAEPGPVSMTGGSGGNAVSGGGAGASGAGGRADGERDANAGGGGGTAPAFDAGATARDSGAFNPADAARDAGHDAGAMDGASAAPKKYPPAAHGGDVAAGLAQLNLYRRAIGASEVVLDAASAVGCEGHVNYLVAEEAANKTVMLSHNEPNHQNPYYSAANEAAGMQSDIAYGTGPSGGQTFGEAVDLWINGLYHRTPLLDPGLTKVGAASKNGYNCLNYAATGNTVAAKLATPTIWPVDGMVDVPRTFIGNEGPCPTAANPTAAPDCSPSGFIPSATFYHWGTARKSAIDSVTSVTLTDQAASSAVPLLVYFADAQAGHDPAPGYVRDEIALVPQSTLAANKTYRIDIDATIQGKATQLSWQFTTGTRSQ